MAIDWRPIDDVPDALKDGREVLVWETVSRGGSEVVTWDPATPRAPLEHRLAHGVWCDTGGATVRGITHFAEIDPPA